MAQKSDGLSAEERQAVKDRVTELRAKTWYGMPGWARDGKIVCFFQSSGKFKSRYCTFGFNDPATLDDGAMWATSFAVTEVTPAVEKRIAALVKSSLG